MQRNIDIPCPIHKGEQCGISFESTEEIVDDSNQKIFVPPTCRRVKTPDELYSYCYSYLATHYRLASYSRNPQILAIKEGRLSLYSKWYKDRYTPASSIALGQMTHHMNPMSVSDVKLARFVPEVADIADRMIYGFAGIKNVAATKSASMLAAAAGSIPSLQSVCIKRLSIRSILTENIETGRGEYPQLCYSTNRTDQNHLRWESLLREFSFDTCDRKGFSRLRPLISPALRDLEFALGTDEFVGKLKFRYSVPGLIRSCKFGTSGGIMNADSISTTIDGVTYKICNSGKKIFLIAAAMGELHTIVVHLAHDKMYVFQPYNVTKLKGEFKYMFDKALEKIPEALFKVREFFIPSLTLTLLSDLIHKYRMLIERGDVITIGVTPWHGGWWQLAVALGYDNPDLMFVDGDIKGLDKHITDWQLLLYLSSGARYYDWAGMNKSQRTLLKRLYQLLLYHVTNKITLQPGTFWRLIRGVMYSGGKETSHGDSWIMGLIFFMYVEHIRQTHPTDAPFIKQCLVMRFIAIIIYGDDHVWSTPKSLRHLLNAASFARFLKEFLGMELRDYREYDSFLSEVDHSTGQMRYRGPKFLKRYWISSGDFDIPGAAPVLPYKYYLEPIVRCCTVTEEEDYFGLMLKCIGQAWDTLGTNEIAYRAIEAIYDWASSKCKGKTPRQLYEEWRVDPTKAKFLTSLAKKSTMKEAEFFESFPPFEFLQSRHEFIPEMCNNRPLVYRPHDFDDPNF